MSFSTKPYSPYYNSLIPKPFREEDVLHGYEIEPEIIPYPGHVGGTKHGLGMRLRLAIIYLATMSVSAIMRPPT